MIFQDQPVVVKANKEPKEIIGIKRVEKETDNQIVPYLYCILFKELSELYAYCLDIPNLRVHFPALIGLEVSMCGMADRDITRNYCWI